MTSRAQNLIAKYLIIGSGPSDFAVPSYLIVNGIRSTIAVPSLSLGSFTPTVISNAVRIVRSVLSEGKS